MGDALRAPPSTIRFLCFVLGRYFWDTGLVWDFQRNPGVFSFASLDYQIGWHHRWSNDVQKATRDIRGKGEVTNQEVSGLSLNSTSNNRQEEKASFTLAALQHPSLKTTMDCVIFLLCLLKLDFIFLGTGTGDDISAFCLFSLAFGNNTTRLGVGTTNNNTTLRLEQDGQREVTRRCHPSRCCTSTRLKRAQPRSIFLCRQTHPDGHGWTAKACMVAWQIWFLPPRAEQGRSFVCND